MNGPLGLQVRGNEERFDWEAVAPVPNVVAEGLVQVNGACYAIGDEPGGFYERLARQYGYAHTVYPRDCAVPVRPAPITPPPRSLTCYADRTGYIYCT